MIKLFNLPQELLSHKNKEDRAHEDGEEQCVAYDAHRPRPDFTAHAAEGAGEPKKIAYDFAPEEEPAAGEF